MLEGRMAVACAFQCFHTAPAYIGGKIDMSVLKGRWQT